MKSIGIKVLLVSIAFGAALFALAGTAGASHVVADVSEPDVVTVGQPAEARVTLRFADTALAVADTPVVFYMDASFGGVEGEVELGRAVTDEQGVAVLRYEPRSAGEHKIRAEFRVLGSSEPEEVSWTHSVAGGGQQVYQSTAGVQIPGLNVWLLIALVAVVWAILLSVALRVVAIARAGTEAGGYPGPTGKDARVPRAAQQLWISGGK